MKIIVNHRLNYHNGKPVETYSRSYIHYLKNIGHDVTEMGEGTGLPYLADVRQRNYDLFLDIDSGRNSKGELCFIGDQINKIKKAVIFTDSHGHPSMHKRLASSYEHVFYAVWACRDLFVNHKSAHFLPNATDLRWFPRWDIDGDINWNPITDFGFFGSKGGLDRADRLKEICDKMRWSYDVRQLNNAFKQKWPYTALAMSNCKFLFNHGQKHDINLRIFESMAVGRPFICDYDKTSGIDKLFNPNVHFVPYDSYTYNGLEDAMMWVTENRNDAVEMAKSAYNLIATKHTVEHRVQSMMEIIGG
jgi:hypothetical protein